MDTTFEGVKLVPFRVVDSEGNSIPISDFQVDDEGMIRIVLLPKENLDPAIYQAFKLTLKEKDDTIVSAEVKDKETLLLEVECPFNTHVNVKANETEYWLPA